MPVQYGTACSRRNFHRSIESQQIRAHAHHLRRREIRRSSCDGRNPHTTRQARDRSASNFFRSIRTDYPAAFTISCPPDEGLKLFRGCELLWNMQSHSAEQKDFRHLSYHDSLKKISIKLQQYIPFLFRFKLTVSTSGTLDSRDYVFRFKLTVSTSGALVSRDYVYC